tara:strand:+ start:150 stop:419 length:270 start_codon:yes stop_codon:yes gene_type:complete
MKSRTAVQILFDDLNFGFDLWFESKITPTEFFNGLIDAHQNALALEEEQIINAWDNGFSNGFDLGKYEEDCKTDDGEQYFNDNFENTNS